MDPAAALLMASDQLSLSRAQRSAVSTLEDNLQASGRGVGAAFRGMRTDLAAQVRSGALDPMRVQSDESVLTDALQTHLTQEVDTLDRLHTALDSTQRAAVVAAVRAEQPGRTEEQAMPEATSGSAARLARMTRELGLDSNQQQRVAALLSQQPPMAPERMDHGERFDQVVSAFASDQFDARATLGTVTQSPATMIHNQVQRETSFLSQLLPVLRPDQREQLASNIEGGSWGAGSRSRGSQGQGSPGTGSQGQGSPGTGSEGQE